MIELKAVHSGGAARTSAERPGAKRSTGAVAAAVAGGADARAAPGERRAAAAADGCAPSGRQR